MSGRRAKKVRKQALALHPEGSTLEFHPTKFDRETGEPVRGHWQYSGYRRAYQDLKRSHYNGKAS